MPNEIYTPMNPYYLNETDTRAVLIFGVGQLSELAWYCLTHDTPYRVAGFILDDEYLLDDAKLFDLPIVGISKLQADFPTDKYRCLVPIGYTDINGLRKNKYTQLKNMGYEFIRYFSSHCYVWNIDAVGENTLIYEHARIQPFAKVGKNVVIRSGAHISHHCSVEDHVFVAAEVAIGGASTVKEQSFVGIGATIADAITVNKKCFIGAGAVVVKNTEEGSLYVGNPAKNTQKSSLLVTKAKHAN